MISKILQAITRAAVARAVTGAASSTPRAAVVMAAMPMVRKAVERMAARGLGTKC